MRSVSIHVIGQVQGVFFRSMTKDRAESLGLKGFVRNQPDGSVYMEVEGDDEKVHKLVDWCGKGPPSAKVEMVDIKHIPKRGFEGFEIRA